MILEHNDEHQYELMTAKCSAMVCMFVATAFVGSVPYILDSFFKWSDRNASAHSELVIRCLLHFGGGVLLATTLVHLLPEVEEVVAYLQNCGDLSKFSFPLAEVLMCAGFFLMYLIEETIHGILECKRQSKCAINEEDTAVVFKRGRSIRNSVLMKSKQTNNAELNNSSLSNNSESTHTELSVDAQSVLNRYTNANEPADKIIAQSHQKMHNDFSMPNSHGNCSSYVSHDSECHSHSRRMTNHAHVSLKHNTNDSVVTSSLRGLFIVLALSLHEIFEGLAIGLEDSTSSVWFLFAAVSAHKLVLAFCIGVELLAAHTRAVLVAVYTLTFALVSPLGILIGLLVSNPNTNEQSIPSVILQGLACGTLLYVVFFEILSKHHCGFTPYATMLLGFGIMFSLQQLGKNDHEHDSQCAKGFHNHTHDHQTM